MKADTRQRLVLSVIVTSPENNCYWCGQGLRQCGMCKGSGLFKGSTCQPCKGQGRICPTHEGDWTR
jgi:hypothetical protein